MLLMIDVNEKDIIINEGGRIVIKLRYFSALSNAAHVLTMNGETVDDFDNGTARKHATLQVGQQGGISLFHK